MNIEGFIEAIEEDYLQDALDKLKENPKELINVYLSAKEFTRAKLMRGNAVPTGDEGEDRHIYIQIEKDRQPLAMPHGD